MTAGGEFDLDRVADGFEDAEDGGAVARVAHGVALVEHGVEGGERGHGVRVVKCRGPQGVAGQGGHGGGLGALAADITEEEGPACAVQREEVVEVSAETVR